MKTSFSFIGYENRFTLFKNDVLGILTHNPSVWQDIRKTSYQISLYESGRKSKVAVMAWAKGRNGIVRVLGDRIGAHVSVFAYMATTTSNNSNNTFAESAAGNLQYRLRTTIMLKPYQTYKNQVYMTSETQVVLNSLEFQVR